MTSLKKGVAIGVVALLLAALGGFSAHRLTNAPSADVPRTLHVVMLGNPNETLDYGRAQTYLPWAVIANVCDVLVRWHQGRLQYQLATAIEPNGDATRWTVRLRNDVRFSDGSPLNATDALASLHFLARSAGFGSFFQDIDFSGSEVVDEHTFKLQLLQPRADLVPSVLAAASVIWKEGKGDAALPTCSGPWQIRAFDGRNGAQLARNPYAWEPALFFDQVSIRPLDDANQRVKALLSGVADYAFDIPVSSARLLQGRSGFRVERSGIANASAFYFAMNTRMSPFNDVEVRQALKALVDRQLLVDVVLGGYGYPGNDLFGQGLPGGNTLAWPIKHDAAAARQLFQEKGISTLTLLTADLTPGLNDASELLRQQLAEVGVTVTVEQIGPADYLADVTRLHRAQLVAFYALNRPFVAAIPALFGRDNPYNYGGWYPLALAERVKQLRATPDPARQQPLLQQLQREIIQNGPYLVWGYRDQLSGTVVGLHGVELQQGVPLFGDAVMNANVERR